MQKSDESIVILGAGLSGLSTAYYLKDGYKIFEKDSTCGGLCRSKSCDGFIFDIAGHILHFKDDTNYKTVSELMNDNLICHSRDSWVYLYECFIRYPFQSNLYGLPDDVRDDCLKGFRSAEGRRSALLCEDGKNFSSWILKMFGSGMSEHFFVPYNEKFWLQPLDSLCADWAKRWIPIPDLKEVEDGANRDIHRSLGYNAKFWYPKKGGIQNLTDSLKDKIKEVNTGCEACRIDLKKKQVFFTNGSHVRYKGLVSTIPLAELCSIIDPLPKDIADAASKLKFISLFNLNIGLKKDLKIKKHWIYYPQSSVPFYRLGISSAFSHSLAPEGQSSLYTEVSYSQENPPDKNKLINEVIKYCSQSFLGFHEEDVSIIDINDVKYAYCVYDHNRQEAVKVIMEYLKDNSLFSKGRYGSWSYLSMEDVMVEAKKTAERMKSRR